MKWAALLALFCLISNVFTQGACPTTGESPAIPDLTDTCFCGSDDTSDYYATMCPQPPPASSLKFTAPTGLLSQSTGSLRPLATNVKAYSTLTIQNLFLGVTYEFATADRSQLTARSPQFDIVLVLRDPSGNVLASNDDCLFYPVTPVPRFTNSYISYTHVSNKFNTVFLSVYQYDVNSRTGDYLCASKPARGVATIFAGAVEYDGPLGEITNFQCSTRLTCNTEVTEETGDVIDPSLFLDLSKSDLCGASTEEGYAGVDMLINSVIVDFEDGYQYDCSDIGKSTVTIRLNDKSCQSSLVVLADEPIVSCVDQTAYTVPRAPFSPCAFLNFEDAYCQFDTSDYVPYVDVDDTCDFELQDLVFDVEYDAFFASIGDSVDYTISVTNSQRLISSDPTTCSVHFLGIQPLTLTQYDENNEPLPLQRGDVINIYYDTVYSLEYFASLFSSDGCTDEEIPIDLIFYTGSPTQIAERHFYPTHFRNDDCSESASTLECKSVSYFCIDSTDTSIPIGYYSIGLITPMEGWPTTYGIDPLDPKNSDIEIKKALRAAPICGGGEPSSVLPGTSTLEKKRIVGVPELVLSLGNPRVYLNYAPPAVRPDPGTCDEANACFMWDSTDLPDFPFPI